MRERLKRLASRLPWYKKLGNRIVAYYYVVKDYIRV